MAKKRTRIEIDEELLLDIEEAVMNGANSNREISDAIGIKPTTFRNWLYKTSTDSQKQRKATIETAIKKGQKRQRRRMMQAAETGLMKLTGGYEVEEVTQVIERYKPKRLSEIPDGAEIDENGLVTKLKTTRRKKMIAPNATAIIFALVNADNERWKSINGADKNEDNPGNIIQWLRDQATAGKDMKKGR